LAFILKLSLDRLRDKDYPYRMAKHIRNIKGILIDPVNRSISEVQVDNGNFLESIYGLLGCNMVEAVSMGTTPESSLWVDEEGLFKRGNPAFAMPGVGPGMFVGKGIILGDAGSESCATSITVRMVKSMVKWTNKVAAI
jgi:hypothetical protein